MGEVYRAHDPRLDRDVAIKVLTSAVSADPERIRRFEHEARAAAALNHPNILTVHEIGQDATAAPPVPYVVSEVLEGATLREALEAGALPLRKAVDYAGQIANGLAAAHAKGIVHRDVKPENLFVTRDGRLKILDFGLAKLTEGGPVASGTGPSMLATRNFETAAGTVLGTMGYMSPEQLRGQAVDERGDIFSFGTVLYEMLSGRRAFQGATAVDTITASLTSDPPDLSAANASIPPALDRIVRHCLEKTPELRYQSARDIVFALEALSIPTASITATMPAAPGGRRLPRAAVYAAVAVAAAALLAGGGRRLFSSRGSEWGAFRQLTFRHGVLGVARFTPDGRSIAYTAAWEDGRPEIDSLGVSESGGRSMGFADARLLAISPKGEMALLLSSNAITPFLTTGALARGSTMGSAPRPEIDHVVEADYLDDGSLAIVRNIPADRQCQLEYPVGTPLLRSGYLSDLRRSPDGRYLAVIEHTSAGDDRGAAVILDLHGKTIATGPVVDSHRGLAWTPSGDEVWTSAPLLDGTIRALDLRGRSRDVLTLPGRIYLRDIAPNGDLLLEQGTTKMGIVAVSDEGRRERDLSWFDYSFLRGITADGQQVFFDEEGSSVKGYRSFVRSVDGSPALEVGEGYALALSPDKAWMLTQKFVGSGSELWLYPVGPGQARRLSPPGWTPTARAGFFPDGKRIVYMARAGTGAPRIYVQALDGGAPTQVGGDGYTTAVLSPDGRWIGAGSASGGALLPTDGGPAVPVLGFQPKDNALGWTSDGRVYVANAITARGGATLKIETVDPHSGRRTLWREIRSPAIEGLRITRPVITPDGTSWAYGYAETSSNLFLLAAGR
jgi:WD40 repeat protein